MIRKYNRVRDVLVLLLALSCFLLSCSESIPPEAPDRIDAVRSFGSVVDGDTIQTYTGRLIRLIGVDAPEKSGPYTTYEQGSRQASDFVRDFLAGTDRIYLEYGTERVDEHGRLLAYVYREGDYRMLNRALIEAGWAEAYRTYSYRTKDEFIKLEVEAREQNRGIWEEN